MTFLMDIPDSVVTDIRRQFKKTDLDTKITFSDFLTLLQKEDFFRETLSEAQMYRMSPVRLEYGHECTLVTAETLRLIE